METYRYESGSWAPIRRRMLVSTAILTSAVFLAVWMIDPTGWREPIFIGTVSIAVFVGVFLGLRRAKLHWSSYEVVATDDRITRRQANTPDIVLERQEVRTVHEAPKKGITLVGPDRFKCIVIPAQLERYDQLRADVLSWAPTPKTSRVTAQPVAIVAGLGTLALFWLAFGGPSPGISALAAGLLAAALIWAFVELRRSPHYDRRTRRGAWFVLLPILALLVRVLRYLQYGD